MSDLMVGALQLPTLGKNATRLEFYLKKASERGARVLLLGEYVINNFFKDLVKMPLEMVKDQTQTHIKKLKKLSREFNIIIVAPIIEVKKNKIYKKIAKISPKSTSYYEQQVLIDYPHWDEESFFANKIDKIKEPMVFTIDGFKIATIFGFEVHFDTFWQYIQKKEVDIVFIPTATTFNSNIRWQELLSMRAFLNSCYILRANRVGEYEETYEKQKVKWNFYGESMLINPDGEIIMNLEDRESMLIEPIVKEDIVDSLDGWGFRRQLKKRGEL
jgi:predicted amidohydrolase